LPNSVGSFQFDLPPDEFLPPAAVLDQIGDGTHLQLVARAGSR